MVTPACRQPAYQKELEAPVEHSNFFSSQKISRLALRTLSLIMIGCAIYIGAHIIVGSSSLLHLASVIGLLILQALPSKVAGRIVDFNDPVELQQLRNGFCAQSMTEMLTRFSLDQIMHYKLAPLDTLRLRCTTDLLESCRKGEPVPFLQKYAEKLLMYRIITPEIHRALADNYLPDLLRLVPGNSVDHDKMFKAFDARS